MKQIKHLLDEMHQYVQAFNRNNQVLKDNWQDKKSEHFSDTCITIVNNTCQEYMQTVEQVQVGINSSLEQLKSMEQELNKELTAPTWSFKG
jgi:uncharacterized protein YukE